MFSIKITRRQFLKWLSASAAAMGLSQTDLLKVEQALAAPPGPVPQPLNPLGPPPQGIGFNAGTLGRVIWIAGAACSGCPTSLLNYIADTSDCEVVLNTIANNAIPGYPLLDLNAVYPGQDGADIDIAEVVLEVVTIDYSQIVMAASGDVPNNYLLSLMADPTYKYVLLVEGTIQIAANGKYCRIMDVLGDLTALPGWPAAATPYVNVYNDPLLGGNRTDVTMAGGTLWLANNPNCLAVVAFGTCAAYGGVPAAKGSVTGGKSAYEWINKINGMGKLMVNIPGCPPHPDWFIATVGAALLELNGVIPGILLNNLDTSLDHKGNPKLTYTGVGCRIFHPDATYSFCQDCDRRDSQPGPAALCDARKSAANPNGLCLYTVGCNGKRNAPQNVRADCPTRKWNTNTNWCVENNMPCQGCTDPGFPDSCSPFYSSNKNPL